MGGEWTNGKCCGDDAGEGGFPYNIEGLNPKAPYSNNAGRYGKEVCDDYYGNEEIDNDCDGETGCYDNDCISSNYAFLRNNEWNNYLNKEGKLCCNQKSQCKQFLDPSSNSDDGVECKSDNTCDCLPVGATEARATITTFPATIKTCVASYDEIIQETSDIFDRLFTITQNSQAERTFQLIVKDIDGGEECKEKVTLLVNDNNIRADSLKTIQNLGTVFTIKFKNLATEDCLVKVRIT